MLHRPVPWENLISRFPAPLASPSHPVTPHAEHEAMPKVMVRPRKLRRLRPLRESSISGCAMAASFLSTNLGSGVTDTPGGEATEMPGADRAGDPASVDATMPNVTDVAAIRAIASHWMSAAIRTTIETAAH